MVDRTAALEEAIRERSRGRLDLLAFSVSPDGDWAVTLLRVRDTGYWLESLYEYGADGWVEQATSNAVIAWSFVREGDDGTGVGVLRYYGEAPADAKYAIVRWRETEHDVPVQNQHFAFAAWDAIETENDFPELVGFRE